MKSVATRSRFFLIATVLCVSGACGSPGSSPASPTGSCPPSISADQLTRAIDAAGGTLTVPVAAQTGCTWTAQSNAGFLTIAPAGGSGTGSVSVTVPANAGSARTGTLTVAGQTVTITQPAPLCSTALSQSTLTLDETATIVTLAVTAAPTCTWTAMSNVAFITVSAGSTTGPGSVTVSIAANPGAPRSGTVVIGNQTLTVNQRQACGYTVSATTVTVPAGGLNTTVSVSTAAGCTWSATANSSFITLLSAAANTGSGAATFSVAPNAGVSRAGTLTVAGHTVSIVQAGTPVVSACVTQLCGKFNPPSATCLAFSNPISGSGGTWDILLSAPPTCSWYLATDFWLTADPPVGTGDATVHLRADPSPSPAARSSVVSAGSASFTVNQNQCAVTVSPSSVNVAVEGATVTITVSTICTSWNVRGNDYPYITVLDGATGSGNGTVTFSVAPNTGAARTAVFGVDFTAVTVRQAGS